MRSLKTIVLSAVALTSFWAAVGRAEVLTLTESQRPEWLTRDGIVMAGSWEPLLFRVRRDGSPGFTPTPEQQSAYQREHSREMIDRLKARGVNFIMTHCYKGAGLNAEKKSMEDAVRFAGLCHDAGMHVGVYNYSGAFLWEMFYKERSDARDWVLLKEDGSPITYGQTTYRYFWNRNHPQAVDFYRGLVKFAVDEVKADLIHFDNYHEGAGFDPQSVRGFRRYLRETFTPDQLRQGSITNVDTILPPKAEDSATLLKYAWQDFQCQYLARSYLDMGRYARSLRKDVLLNCNPMSVPHRIYLPVDHSRILPGGEAFWNESFRSGVKDGKLMTRIRSFKLGRLLGNMVFFYIITPLDAAESMAFNHPDCLGCVCWFEYANIVNRPGSKEPMSPELDPYIHFYHHRRDLFRESRVVADVAILRSFPSQVYPDGSRFAQVTAEVEDQLIAGRIPFQIIYEPQLDELKRWPVLVLAGCVALSDRQIKQITDYVQQGGTLCVVGPVGTHDEWLRPRESRAFQNLPASAVRRADHAADVVPKLCQLRDEKLSLAVEADGPLCTELTDQPSRRLVHLVNYEPANPIPNVAVRVRLPNGRTTTSIQLANPEQRQDREVSFSHDENTVRFVVPRVSTYAVAIVNLN